MSFYTQTRAVFLYNMMTVVSGRLNAGPGDETCTVNMHGAPPNARVHAHTHILTHTQYTNLQTGSKSDEVWQASCVWVSHDRNLLLAQRLQAWQASLCMGQP